MPRKPYFNPKVDKYILVYREGMVAQAIEFFTAASAVEAYRNYRKAYGDTVCLTKVVIDHGEEV